MRERPSASASELVAGIIHELVKTLKYETPALSYEELWVATKPETEEKGGLSQWRWPVYLVESRWDGRPWLLASLMRFESDLGNKLLDVLPFREKYRSSDVPCRFSIEPIAFQDRAEIAHTSILVDGPGCVDHFDASDMAIPSEFEDDLAKALGSVPEARRGDLRTYSAVYCANCGAVLQQSARVCSQCGEPTGNTAAEIRLGWRPGSVAARHSSPVTPRHEMKEFVIPLPGARALQGIPVKEWSDLSREFLRAAGVDWPSDNWASGMTRIWESNRQYLLERLNDLGAEGWELDEPFEPRMNPELRYLGVDNLADPRERFVFDETSVKGVFGHSKRVVLKGAKFRMRRTTFS